MKNLCKLILLITAALFSFSSVKAQTIFTSGNLTLSFHDTVYHDSTYCSSNANHYYVVTKTGSFLGDSVLVIDTATGYTYYNYHNTTGAASFSNSFSIGNITTDLDIIAGVAHMYFDVIKIRSGADTIFHQQDDSIAVPNPCTYGTVTGSIYIDNNGNCVNDAGDTTVFVWPSCSDNLSGGGVTMGILSSLPSTSFCSNFLFHVQQSWMTNYTVSLDSEMYFIFPPSSCFAGPYSFTTLPQTHVDFPLQCSGNLDVQCWAGNPGRVRPARSFYMQPYVNNLGCNGVSGVLTLVKDSRVAYDPTLSAYPADSVHGDTLQWYYYNISSLSNGSYWNSFMANIHMTPDSAVTMGDTLCFHIYTGVPAADINPANNDFMVCIPVVTSYDPNEKESFPQGDGPAGDIPLATPELTYTIHFQNTGAADAIDIHIMDTLDSHIDPTSLKILSASHIMTPRWRAANVIDFQFPNIMLADSFSNEPASHGYVRFKARLNSGLAAGTQIKNKGYIYFDTNPAVVTNEALNTLAHTTAVPAVAISEVKIYPNPATDNIIAENLQGGTLSILSISGTVVLEQNITGNKTEINISRLPVGMYILKTVNSQGTTTRKFVKE